MIVSGYCVLYLMIVTVYTHSKIKTNDIVMYVHTCRLKADAKVPNLAGITVEKIFGAVSTAVSVPSVKEVVSVSGGGDVLKRTYGISKAANAYYSSLRTDGGVETVQPVVAVRPLGELLINDRDPLVAPTPTKGTLTEKLLNFKY